MRQPTARACRRAATPRRIGQQDADVSHHRAEESDRHHNLDRIQTVKGWLDANGGVQEKVYDVVWGHVDQRRPGTDGKLPAVGNMVDVPGAPWTNTIGDPALITARTDPNSDQKLRAFYYARHKDPDAALDRLQRQALRPNPGPAGADSHPETGVHLADLVYAARKSRTEAYAPTPTGRRRLARELKEYTNICLISMFASGQCCFKRRRCWVHTVPAVCTAIPPPRLWFSPSSCSSGKRSALASGAGTRRRSTSFFTSRPSSFV